MGKFLTSRWYRRRSPRIVAGVLFFLALIAAACWPAMPRWLYSAAESGNVRAARIILTIRPGLVNAWLERPEPQQEPHSGWLRRSDAKRILVYVHCLGVAVENDQLRMVEFLLSHGAGPNLPQFVWGPHTGYAALHFAHNAPMAELLLRYGADPNHAESDGTTPLFPIQDWIQRTQRVDWPPLDVAQVLLARGADLSRRDIYGATPLHIACATDHTGRYVGLLLENGADVMSRNKHGSTPLHYFRLEGPDGASALAHMLAAGAELDARDGKGLTPLHYAARASKTGSVKLLLEAGAQPSLEDDEGHTALYHAARWRNGGGVIRLLLAAQAGWPETGAQLQEVLALARETAVTDPQYDLAIILMLEAAIAAQVSAGHTPAQGQ